MKPLGIDIAPIPDMAVLQTIVAAALAAKRSADTPRKTRWAARAESMACRPSALPGLPASESAAVKKAVTRAPAPVSLSSSAVSAVTSQRMRASAAEASLEATRLSDALKSLHARVIPAA